MWGGPVPCGPRPTWPRGHDRAGLPGDPPHASQASLPLQKAGWPRVVSRPLMGWGPMVRAVGRLPAGWAPPSCEVQPLVSGDVRSCSAARDGFRDRRPRAPGRRGVGRGDRTRGRTWLGADPGSSGCGTRGAGRTTSSRSEGPGRLVLRGPARGALRLCSRQRCVPCGASLVLRRGRMWPSVWPCRGHPLWRPRCTAGSLQAAREAA